MADKQGLVRISIALPDDLREQFFLHCRTHKPKLSMNERLIDLIRADIAGKTSVPRKTKPPRPR